MTLSSRAFVVSTCLLGLALLSVAAPAAQPAKNDRAAKKSAKKAEVKAVRKQAKTAPLPPPKTPAEELAAVNTKAMRLALDDLIGVFGSRYPKGPEYLTQLAKMEARKQAIEAALAKKDAGAAEQAAAFVKEFRGFQQEALLANPLLDFDRLLLVKRDVKSPKLGLPQNWQGNCALPKTGYDNEIAVLSPVRPEGKLTTLYKPHGGRVRRRRGPALRRRQAAVLHARVASPRAAGRSGRSRPTARACGR